MFFKFFKFVVTVKKIGAGAVRVCGGGTFKLGGGGRLMVLKILYHEATLGLISFE